MPHYLDLLDPTLPLRFVCCGLPAHACDVLSERPRHVLTVTHEDHVSFRVERLLHEFPIPRRMALEIILQRHAGGGRLVLLCERRNGERRDQHSHYCESFHKSILRIKI